MKHAATQSLFDYWNRLRAGRAAPERAEIDPAEIRGVLADTFLLEIAEHAKPDPDVLVRLSGSRVNALFATDVRDRRFLDLWRETDRPDIRAMLTSVLEDRRPVVAGVSAAPVGYIPVAAELLLLPLRHLGKTHVRLLGALTPASVPSWLGLVGSDQLRLASWRVIEPSTPDPAPAEDGRATPARRPTDLLRRTLPLRRGHFVVHQGGREEDSTWSLSK